MKSFWIVLIIIGIIFISGCSPEKIVEEPPQEIAAPIIEEEKEESKVSELPKDSPTSENERTNELYEQFNDFEKSDPNANEPMNKVSQKTLDNWYECQLQKKMRI